jgi:DNA repair protein RadA/Sms
MARVRTVHRCRECGAGTPRWSGRCLTCGAWGSLVEEAERAPSLDAHASHALSSGAEPVPLEAVEMASAAPVPTGVDELDRVLGGGLVPGSVTLLGGEPGIGKSTLLLQVLGSLAARGARGLLVSAEESAPQVRRRAERLGAVAPGLWLVAETTLPGIRHAVEKVEPDVVVVDSIQTVWDPDLDSVPGSVGQVRGCAHELAALARRGERAVVLVGHVTKDGALAGPRVLEHLVDTVLTFEGDRHHGLRMLRSVKHRFGSTGELGLFEMTDAGMVGVPDASGVFLGDRSHVTPGSVVFPAVEGARPLLVELQALVASSRLPAPRRSASGLDQGRLGLLLAVLDRRAGVSTVSSDVYVSAVGGVRVAEPGADLAICLAVASATIGRPLPPDLVVIGEVGLGGELRQVAHTARRLAEAARLGFSRAVVPASAPEDLALRAVRVATLRDAVEEVIGAPEARRDGEAPGGGRVRRASVNRPGRRGLRMLPRAAASDPETGAGEGESAPAHPGAAPPRPGAAPAHPGGAPAHPGAAPPRIVLLDTAAGDDEDDEY